MRIKRGKRLYLGYRALGVPLKLAARHAGMRLGSARRLCERCGGPKSELAIMCWRCRGEESTNMEAQRLAVALYRQDLTMKEVGLQMGVTKERVRQILARTGEPRRRQGPLHDPTVHLNRAERLRWRANYRRQRRFYRRYRAAKAFHSGMSLTEVAVEILGAHHASVAARVLRGVKMRPVGRRPGTKYAAPRSAAEIAQLLDGRETVMTAKVAHSTATAASHRGLRVTRRSLSGGMIAVRCVGAKLDGG